MALKYYPISSSLGFLFLPFTFRSLIHRVLMCMRFYTFIFYPYYKPVLLTLSAQQSTLGRGKMRNMDVGQAEKPKWPHHPEKGMTQWLRWWWWEQVKERVCLRRYCLEILFGPCVIITDLWFICFLKNQSSFLLGGGRKRVVLTYTI